MEAHDILLIIKFCVSQRFTYMCKVDCDPKITEELREAIDANMFGFGEPGQVPTGIFWRVLMAMGADEVPEALQLRLLRRVQMREEDGGLGLQSARTLGQYASLSAIANIMSTKAAVVQGMPCIDYLRTKILEEHGGGCRLAAVTRQRIKEFAATHKNELDQLPNIRDGLAAVGRAPQTPEQLVAPNNNVTQAAMYAVTSKRDRNRWLMTANRNELFFDEQLAGGEWRIALLGTPTHRRLKLTNQAVRGHLRLCLMMPEPQDKPTCVCLQRPASRTHILACSLNNISQQTETHNLVRDTMYDFCRASGVNPGNAEPRGVQGSLRGSKVARTARPPACPSQRLATTPLYCGTSRSHRPAPHQTRTETAKPPSAAQLPHALSSRSDETTSTRPSPSETNGSFSPRVC